MQIKNKITRSVKFVRKYFLLLLTLFFLIWILFLSDSSVIRYYKLQKEVEEMQSGIEYYEEKNKEVKRQLQIMEDDYYLEKYAREKYYMKCPDEDVFIFEKSKGQ